MADAPVLTLLGTFGPDSLSGWVEHRFRAQLPDGWKVTAVTLYSDGVIGVAAAPEEPSDEDRIRGAMAEAQDHPGRIVTR
jgi:hypothetical protein